MCKSPMKHHASYVTRSHGFSMMEVLVTLIVLSIGLLGLAAMQAKSMQNTHGAYLRTQASYLAYDMFDRMRANIVGVNTGNYNGIDTENNDYDSPACLTAGCTTVTMAAEDAAEWETDLAVQLPGGEGAIVAGAGLRVFTITVTWGDPDTGDTTDFSMTSQL